MTATETLNERRHTHLIETDELDAQIQAGNPNLRIVDMRGYVKIQTTGEGVQTSEYVGAASDYAASHLPGAIYLDWTRDIIDENDPVEVQVAPPDKMARILGAAGIGDDSLIVAYDAHPNSQFATRLWWALRYYGHENVRVLNGGWPKWTRENRAASANIPNYPPAVFTPRPHPEWRATAEDVLALLNQEEITILDARDDAQFTGKIRRGSRGGRIPTARLLDRAALFAPDGTYRDPESLQSLVTSQGVAPDKHIVAYCNGGVGATSVLFALSMLGYPQLTNYDGSWNEWSERPDLPIETGNE